MNAPDRAALIAASLDGVHIAQSLLDEDESIKQSVLHRYLVDRVHLPPPIVQANTKVYEAPALYSTVNQTWVITQDVIRDKYLKLMLSRQGVSISASTAISQIGRIVQVEMDVHAGVASARVVLPVNTIGRYEDQGFSTNSLILKWTIENSDAFKEGDFIHLDLSNQPHEHEPDNAIWIQRPTKVCQPELNPFLYVDPVLSKVLLLIPKSTRCIFLGQLIEIQARMFSLLCLPDRQLTFAQLTRKAHVLESFCRCPSSTTSHDCSTGINLLHTLAVQAKCLIDYEQRPENVHMDLSLLLLTAFEHDFTKHQEYVELSALQYWLSESGVKLGHDRSLIISILMSASEVAYQDVRLNRLLFALGCGRDRLKCKIGDLVCGADQKAAEEQRLGNDCELIRSGILKQWDSLDVIRKILHKGGILALGLNDQQLADALEHCRACVLSFGSPDSPVSPVSPGSAGSSVVFTTTPTTVRSGYEALPSTTNDDGYHHG